EATVWKYLAKAAEALEQKYLALLYEGFEKADELLAQYWEKKANDPADPNYQTVAQPVAVTLPPLTGGPGVSQQVLDAANALQAAVGKSLSYQQALVPALNRATGAAEAGDAAARARQVQAAAQYGASAADALDTLIALRTQLKAALDSSGTTSLLT